MNSIKTFGNFNYYWSLYTSIMQTLNTDLSPTNTLYLDNPTLVWKKLGSETHFLQSGYLFDIPGVIIFITEQYVLNRIRKSTPFLMFVSHLTAIFFKSNILISPLS